MSHSPQPPSQEIYDAEKVENNPDAEKNYLKWQEIEKKLFLKLRIFCFSHLKKQSNRILLN